MYKGVFILKVSISTNLWFNVISKNKHTMKKANGYGLT